jgi:biopolymer transport protein ExbB
MLVVVTMLILVDTPVFAQNPQPNADTPQASSAAAPMRDSASTLTNASSPTSGGADPSLPAAAAAPVAPSGVHSETSATDPSPSPPAAPPLLALLPSDLSPWSMFINADIVVKR